MYIYVYIYIHICIINFNLLGGFTQSDTTDKSLGVIQYVVEHQKQHQHM